MHQMAHNGSSHSIPVGNHGEINLKRCTLLNLPNPARERVSLDVSEVVASHLDHIGAITGQTRSAIVATALIDALPDYLARADALKKRHQELRQVKR